MPGPIWVVLADPAHPPPGRTLVVVPEVRRGEHSLLDAVLAGMSPRSRYLRFHGATPRLTQAVRLRLVDVDGCRCRGDPLPARAHPSGLTAREVEVLGLLREGATNTEIAARLVLSVRTVDHHVSAILAKPAAPTRREAVVAADRLGP